MEDELDMETELERELQQEQADLEEELCLQQVLESELQGDVIKRRPLGKVLSLPANFMYSTGATSQDLLNIGGQDSKNERRASSISYQSPYRIRRRQTFHVNTPLLPPSYTSVYSAEQVQDKIEQVGSSVESKKEEVTPSKRKSLRRMSSVDSRRKSFSVGGSRRSSLFGPRPGDNFLTISKSGNIVVCPSPEQLLSLTELVCDEKTRERRILRKALSMDSRTSDDISPECIAPNVTLVPPPYPGDKILLRSPDEDRARKFPDRRPSFSKQKSTETMEIIDEKPVVQINKTKKMAEKRKPNFRQMSLDSKQLYEKSCEVCPDEIAMVVEERRPPHLRELRSRTQDILLSDESQLSTIFSEKTDSTSEEKKPTLIRQMTAPETSKHSDKKLNFKLRKPNLVRQDRQEIVSTESLVAKEDYTELLEQSSPFKRSPFEATQETSLTVKETDRSHIKTPSIRDSKLYGVSMETTSTSSNSTNLTNLRSDSILSEDMEKEMKLEEKDCIVVIENTEKYDRSDEEQNVSLLPSSEECADDVNKPLLTEEKH